MTGTHTLKLEFSRSDSYEISTAMATHYNHTQIEAEFVDEILTEQIESNFRPEEIFCDYDLKQWAEDHGYTKETT